MAVLEGRQAAGDLPGGRRLVGEAGRGAERTGGGSGALQELQELEPELEAFPAEAEGGVRFLGPPRCSECRRQELWMSGARSACRELAGEEGSTAATTRRDRDQNLTLRGWEARGRRN